MYLDQVTRSRWSLLLVTAFAAVTCTACERTSIDGLNVRAAPTTASEVVGTIDEVDTSVRIECYTAGEPVRGDPVWYRISRPVDGYVTNYYVTTTGDVLAREDAC